MEGHAPLPDGKNLQRMGKVEGELVEKDVTEPPTQYDAHGAVKHKIRHIVGCQRQQLAAGFGAENKVGGDEGQNVHQPVPAELERADA